MHSEDKSVPWGDRPLRVAVAGAGFVTPYHIAGWRAQPGVTVIALCASNQRQAEARAQAHGIGKVYDNVESMLDNERPDVLDICTPPAAHGAHIAAAVSRGIHIMCQKPLAPSWEEARAIAHETTGVRAMVHENFRFRPWYREAQRQLTSGRIGEPFYFRSDGRMAGTVLTATHTQMPYSVARQPYFANTKPLLLLDSAIHQIDTCRFLLGREFTTVYARARRIGTRVTGEDLICVHATLPGVEAVIERSYASRGYGDPMASENVAIEGTRGTLFVERDGAVRIEIDVPGERASERIPFDAAKAYPQSYADTIAHFTACLRRGAAFETSLQDNLKTLKAVFAAYRSIDAGQVVGLPLDCEVAHTTVKSAESK